MVAFVRVLVRLESRPAPAARVAVVERAAFFAGAAFAAVWRVPAFLAGLVARFAVDVAFRADFFDGVRAAFVAFPPFAGAAFPCAAFFVAAFFVAVFFVAVFFVAAFFGAAFFGAALRVAAFRTGVFFAALFLAAAFFGAGLRAVAFFAAADRAVVFFVAFTGFLLGGVFAALALDDRAVFFGADVRDAVFFRVAGLVALAFFAVLRAGFFGFGADFLADAVAFVRGFAAFPALALVDLTAFLRTALLAVFRDGDFLTVAFFRAAMLTSHRVAGTRLAHPAGGRCRRAVGRKGAG